MLSHALQARYAKKWAEEGKRGAEAQQSKAQAAANDGEIAAQGHKRAKARSPAWKDSSKLKPAEGEEKSGKAGRPSARRIHAKLEEQAKETAKEEEEEDEDEAKERSRREQVDKLMATFSEKTSLQEARRPFSRLP